MIQSIYPEMESASAARPSANTLYYALQVRVGLRASATKRLMPLLQEFFVSHSAKVVAHCFDPSASGTLFALVRQEVNGPEDFRNEFNVWCEQKIDQICGDFPWDGVPLVYDPTQPDWSDSTILVTCTCITNVDTWFETYKPLCIFERSIWEAASQATFDLAFNDRHLLKSVVPVSVHNYLKAFKAAIQAVPKTALLQSVTDDEERQVLIEKADRLHQTRQLKLLPEELSLRETELFSPLMERLSSAGSPSTAGQGVDVLRSLLNLMGYSAKEQDYLLLLGCSEEISSSHE